MGLFKRKEKKEEYFDVSDLLKQVQEAENWAPAVFKEPQEGMDDDLIYYNSELNLAFKFIIDEETDIVGMKKVEPDILDIKDNKKSM